MEQGYLLERDALNGSQGRAFAVINGRNVEMFGLEKFHSDADFQEEDFKVVGTRLVQKKTTGILLTGSMTIYYGTPEFIQLVQTYIKTGRVPYFTIQVTNSDPATTVGKQTVAFYNVKLQKIPLAILDADISSLTLDVNFSFTSFEILQAFRRQPTQLGSN